MILTGLLVQDFRNLAHAELEPDPLLTVISGQNGQGKTNLLESIWMLSGAKSFRGARDQELIRRGETGAFVQGAMRAALCPGRCGLAEEKPDKTAKESAGSDRTEKDGAAAKKPVPAAERESETAFSAAGREDVIKISWSFSPETGRTARTAQKNGVDWGRAGNIAGEFPCVVFAPGHIGMVRGAPESRRRFADAALCQLYPGYLDALRRYLRAQTQKNAYLKDCRAMPADDSLLDSLDDQLALYGAMVSARRRQYLEALAPSAAYHYDGICGGRERLGLEYRPSTPQEWDREALLASLRACRGIDLRAGCCTQGPHRDDIEFLLDGEPARLYASQGQQRSAVLSCKIAELEQVSAVTGQLPVLLLDDVLSELDSTRQDYLLNKIEGKQVFITSCGTDLFSSTGGKIVTMDGGRLLG